MKPLITKKLGLIFIITLLAALMLPMGVEARNIIINAGEASLYLNPYGLQAVTNDATQTLQVMVDDVTNLTAYHLELTYDPADITVTAVRNGSVLTSPTETALFEPTNWVPGNDTGTILFGMAQQGTGGDPLPVTLTEPGVLLEIDFTIYTQGETMFTLDGTNSMLVSWPDAFTIPYLVPAGQGTVTYALDTVAPTIVSGLAKGAPGFDDEALDPTDLSFTVPQGFQVSTIDITMSEPVTVALGTVVTITPGGVYGTVTAVSGAVITITPNAGNETAALVGDFSFSVPAGSVNDQAGNAWVNTPITLHVLDVTAPTISSIVANGATGFPNVTAVANTLTVDQGYKVATIGITMSEPVAVVLGTEVTVNPQNAVYGTVTAVNGAVITITPAAGNELAAALGTFTFTVPDGAVEDLAGNAWANVPITLTVNNVAPVAGNDAYTVAEDGVLTVPAATGLLANDTDYDPSILTSVLETGPANGALTLNSDGSFTYTPAADFHGTDTFTYTAFDGIDNSNIATVTITVTSVLDTPTVSSTNLTGPYMVGLEQDFQVTLTNPDNGDAFTNVLARFRLGNITQADIASFQYLETSVTPNVWMNLPLTRDGTDVIGDFGPSTGFPMGVPYSATSQFKVTFNTPGTYTATIVLYDVAADPDFELDRYTADVVVVADFSVTDVVLTRSVDQTTWVNVPGTFAGGFEMPLNTSEPYYYFGVSSITATRPLADGSYPFYLTANPGAEFFVYWASRGVVAGATGWQGQMWNIINGDAPMFYLDVVGTTYSLIDGLQGAPNLLRINGDYLPGAYAFTGVVEDQYGFTDELPVNIIFNDIPVAANQTVTTAEDTEMDITLDVADLYPGTLEWTVGTPTNGTLSGSAPNMTYTPDANWFGTDSFTFSVSDGTLVSNTATVTITVSSTNDAPVAASQTVTTAEDTALDITLTAADVEGDPLTFAIDTQPANGSVVLVGNVATYTPNPNYNGTDSFTFRANDGTADSNIATVTITVTPVNDAPVAVDDSYTTAFETALTVTAPGVLTNDTDADGDSLTSSIVRAPSNGTVTLNADGSFTYTPITGFSGVDTFTYKVSDGTFDSNVATVSITVLPWANTAPVAVDDTYETDQNVQLVVPAPGVLANDSDIDGDTLTTTLLNSVSNGTLELFENGSFTYSPNTDFCGTDSFVYTLVSYPKINADGWTDTATVTITVYCDPIISSTDIGGPYFVGTLQEFNVRLQNPAPGHTYGSLAASIFVDNITLTDFSTVEVKHPITGLWVPLTPVVDGTGLRIDLGPISTIPLVSGFDMTLTFRVNFNKAGSFPVTGTLYNGAIDPSKEIATYSNTMVVDALGDFGPAVSFGYVAYDAAPNGWLRGLSAVFTIVDVDLTGATNLVVKLLGGVNGDILLQTNTSVLDGGLFDGFTGFTTPFDIFGNFDYAAYGYWTNLKEAEYGQSVPPTCVEATATLFNGKIITKRYCSLLPDDRSLMLKGTIEPDGGTGQIPGGTPLVITNVGDNVSYLGEIAWYPADPSIGRTAGNRVGVKINAPTAFDTTNTTFTVFGNTYNWDEVKDGENFVWVYPKVTTTPQSWDIVVTWAEGFAQTFTVDVLEGSTLAPTRLGTIERDPGNTGDVPGGTPLVVTQVGDTISFASDIAWYPADLTVGRTEGHRVGVQVNAPAGFDTTDTTFTVFGSTYNWNDVKDGENFVWIYPKVTTTPQSWDIVVTWEEGNVQTFTVDVLTGSTLNDSMALEWLQANTVLAGTLDDFSATFPSYIPATIVDQDYVIDSRITLTDPLPTGSTVTVFKDGVEILTDITLTGTGPFWFTQLFDPDATRAPFDANYGGQLEGYSIVVTAPAGLPADFDTTVLIESVISKDAYITETVLDDITFNIHMDDAVAPSIGSAVAKSASDGDVNLFDGKFTVNQGYFVDTIEITMDEPVLVDLGTVITMVDHGPYGTVTAHNGAVITVTPYPGNETAAVIGSFSFTAPAGAITDLRGNVFSGSIGLEVLNVAPVAVDDAYSVAEDGALTVPAATGVLANDTDFDPTVLTAVLEAGPADGALTLNADGSFTYTPTANYNGTVTFTYKAYDGHDYSNIATVTITVTSENDAPVAAAQSVTTAEDTAVAITLVATDVDGDALTYSIVSGPTNGTLSGTAPDMTYTPNPDWNGTDSFTFKANDGTLDSNIATVSITVTPINDAPAAVDDDYTVAEGGSLTIVAPGVLGNDSDVDGDTLSAVLVDDVTNGTLTFNADGSFTYTPTPYFNGSDSFTYKASDGNLQSELAVVTFTVTPVNEWVIANDDYYETTTDMDLVKDAAQGVLANDVLLDPEEIVSIQIMEAPQHGTLTMNDDGSFTYIPDAGYMGTDTFHYLVMSVNPVLQGEWSDDAYVTIVVKPFMAIYLPIIVTK
ncbi:MAG: Ig-like domain-containing protein [Anaerolineaceae bacterium]